MTKSLERLQTVPQISSLKASTLSLSDCCRAVHLNKYEPQAAGIAIVEQLYKTTVLLNADISKEHLAVWAQDILSRYPTETIEDIAYVLNKGITRKIYGTFNINTFYEWFAEHLENKADQREAEHNNLKGSDPYERTSKPMMVSTVSQKTPIKLGAGGHNERRFEG